MRFSIIAAALCASGLAACDASSKAASGDRIEAASAKQLPAPQAPAAKPIPPPASSYVNGGDKTVMFDASDAGAQSLLSTAVSCGGIADVTLHEFLLMRALQGRPAINPAYLVHSGVLQGKDVTSILETDENSHGEPINPEQPLVSFTYDRTSLTPQFIGAVPETTYLEDPLTFLAAHHDAACNGLVMYHMINGPTPLDASPPQPSEREVVAHLEQLIAAEPIRQAATRAPTAAKASPAAEVDEDVSANEQSPPLNGIYY